MEEATKLRCRNDHFEMAAWQIKAVPGGFWVYVACELGDHYLAPAGRYGVQAQLIPHVWLDSITAFGAVDAWRQEHQ